MTDADRDDRARAVSDRIQKPLLAAALLTIPATILELANVGEPWRTVGEVLNWVIWLAFVADLVVMLVLVRKRGRYLLDHPLDVAIVLLTPPFLLSAVQTIRVLRLLRLLRLARLPGLTRTVFSLEGVKFAVVIAWLTVIGGGVGFASVEHIRLGDGIYWAIGTMTTVGYGDIVPHHAAGKVIAIVVMIVGIGTAGLILGAVTERFIAPSVAVVEVEEKDLLGQVRDISARLQALERALAQRRP